ncbi:hypothetical protein [Mycobacterium shimoidei]|uniref:hypothetical protein n=1 Tax=Mycobacterium shimoidei TaxID=29313 RepID=UPI0008491C92|nr:hypothetical protein [Mycobacterium shimoidei]ODR12531.1 hypothetical protein BHQ16_15405 [Mycobacterium shimoidei]
MRPGRRAIIELLSACAAAAAGVLAAAQVRSVEFIEPVLDGQPVTTSVAYDPPTLLLTLLLAAATGVLVVVGLADPRRSRYSR